MTMEILRSGMKAPIALPWVSVADISDDGVDGTNTVASSMIEISYHGLSLYEARVEIEVTIASLSNTDGIGVVYAWLNYRNQPFWNQTTTPNQDAPAGLYSYRLARAQQGAGAVKTERVFMQPNFLSSRSGTNINNECALRIEAAGVHSDTTWSVTNIRARLVYTPL